MTALRAVAHHRSGEFLDEFGPEHCGHPHNVTRRVHFDHVGSDDLATELGDQVKHLARCQTTGFVMRHAGSKCRIEPVDITRHIDRPGDRCRVKRLGETSLDRLNTEAPGLLNLMGICCTNTHLDEPLAQTFFHDPSKRRGVAEAIVAEIAIEVGVSVDVHNRESGPCWPNGAKDRIGHGVVAADAEWLCSCCQKCADCRRDDVSVILRAGLVDKSEITDVGNPLAQVHAAFGRVIGRPAMQLGANRSRRRGRTSKVRAVCVDWDPAQRDSPSLDFGYRAHSWIHSPTVPKLAATQEDTAHASIAASISGRNEPMSDVAGAGGPDSAQLVRLLAESDRRRVVAVLVLNDGPLTPNDIAQAAELTLRVVIDALDRLSAGGLVADAGAGFELLDDAFSRAARTDAPPPRPSEHKDQPHDVARILDAAFRDGELVRWPAKRSKRLVVLDHLSQQFDVGVRYTERQVDDTLRRFDPDVATMRRYLVDDQFLDRGEGEYWRCGGSI